MFRMKGRLKRTIAKLEEQGLTYALISTPENVMYLTAFKAIGQPPKPCHLLISAKEPKAKLLVSPLDYEEAMESVGSELEVVKLKTKSVADALSKILPRGRGVLGVELGYVNHLFLEELKSKLKDVELKDFSSQVEELRAVKDSEEVEAIKKAVQVAEEAIKKGLNLIVEEATEREIAAEIEYEARKAGAEGVAFDTIVASGPYSAYPHRTAGERKVRKGEAVVLDVGVRVKGYCSDITRTVVLGKIPEKLEEAYVAVLEAQEEASRALKPGVKASTVDAKARTWLKRKKLARWFIHGVGHGVGLSVHEKPALAPKSHDRLMRGNVVTLEPGIYLDKLGGVRVEDMYLVVKEGAMKLTTLEPRLVL